METISKIYPKILESIKHDIVQDGLSARQDYEHRNVIINWNVGRSLESFLSSKAGPRKSNAEIVSLLAKDLKRPVAYFYRARKFFHLYPQEPKKSKLTWCHYSRLITVKDPFLRHKYEEMVIKQNIGFKELDTIIQEDRRRAKLNKLSKYTEDELKRPRLLDVRGRLYHYRVTEHKSIRLSDKVILVDIGFGVRREVFVPPPHKIHGGYTVRTIKVGDRYGVKLSSLRDEGLYTYKAFIETVVDADTVDVNIDCGFQTWVHHRLRLRGINAAEVDTQQGRKAKYFVQRTLKELPFIVVKTYKEGKYGRMLADIFFLPEELDAHKVASDGLCLNQVLLNEGLAEVSS